MEDTGFLYMVLGSMAVVGACVLLVWLAFEEWVLFFSWLMVVFAVLLLTGLVACVWVGWEHGFC